MDQPPSTTSATRTARRALKSGVVALSAIAAPVVLVATTAGGTSTLASAHQAPARREIHTEDASNPVRFVAAGTTFGTGLGTHLVNGELFGVQYLAAHPSAVAPTTTTTVTTPPPAPTTTTTAPPPVAKAPAPAPAPVPAAAPVAVSATASAGGHAYGDPADPATWDRLAQCEAGGNWARNSGNGYYGGLQFSAGTWRAVGGTGLPSQNSRETQIEMGRRLQARSGWGQWPACSRSLHYR